MSFDALLTHTVHVERDVATGTETDYGQPETMRETGGPFRAAIQPRSAREMALLTQAGASFSDHTIFMRPRLLGTEDKIVHDSSTCPVAETADFGDIVFEITGIRNAAGLGHHLEVDAKLIGQAAGVAGS